MSRLVDYFVVVGYDFDKQRGSASTGRVVQRFPETDWADVPFIDEVGVFCQPQGWRITSHQPSPSFYTAVLTDFVGRRNYCSCLTFYEEAAVQPVRHMDEADMDALDDSDMPFVDFSGGSQCTMFVPKCLVILSRNFYLETYRECLSVIFTVLVDEMDFRLEKLIGNLLALIKIPAGNSLSSMTFTLGAGDEHTIKIRDESQCIPATGTCVQRLFEDLGIHAVVTLFSALMSEHKILFHSKSYTRLQDACHALTSLMYPFKYTHTYIPLLPSYLFEVLNAPTPFVIGVHSSLKNEVSDILDVIIVDLDGGYIAVPDCVHVPTLDESSSADLLNLLCAVIRPQLACADDAFPVCQPSPSAVHVMDKEIRAIFIRFFALLLTGYRTCLQTVRIHPKPFITFHKAVFLGRRNLIDNEFAVRILDSMFFSSFIQERGPPFRPCDLFDDLYADLDRTLEQEHQSPDLVIPHIKEIANKLLLNESIDEEIGTMNKWKPSANLGSRTFPLLDSQIITGIIESELIREEMEGNQDGGEGNEKIAPKLVAIGPTSSLITDVNSSITNSARRLEVMKNCIQCIFEDRILDAKKTFPAVLRTLKNNTARLALAQELSHYVSGAKAILRHDQFDLVVRLMNCALQQDCDDLGNSAAGLSGYEDVNGVAAAIIPLSMAFCRKLHTHVIQFAYTCVQGHAIWNNQSFWESSFYQNVSKDISALYSSKDLLLNHLDVVAQQMRLIHEGKVDDGVITENEANEVRTLFSQVVHFSNTIIALKIPLDVGTMDKTSRNQINNSGEGHSDTTSNATGNAGRESWRDERDEREPRDDESGFEEDKSGSQGKGAKNEIQENVIKFITRFQDKVCSEGELSEDDIRRLHSLIPGLVQMQADTLDQVYKESRKLPPVSKPKIMLPDLLPGEEVTCLSGLRVFLIPDGRDENYAPRNASNCAPGVGPVLLPAEGAIFLTNYRIIFRGRPCDPFYAESSVVRSFPIATLTKEKRINIPANHFVAAIDHMISEGLQLRSNAFQLLTIAFDEEVTPDSIEMFKKMVNKARSPADIFTLFAFTSQVTTATQYKYLNQQKQKDKGSTFKNVGKKTLRRAAAMTGFQSKSKHKSHKYLVQSLQSGTPRKLSPTDSFDENSLDNVSFTSEARSVTTLPPSQFTSPLHMAAAGSLKEKDTRELQKLCDLLYVKDYQRLRLGSAKDMLPAQSSKPHSKMQPMPSDSFKITCVNSGYSVVSSYPSFIVIPRIISDESVKKFARGYRQGRFPVITWKHKKGGLLLRGSSFHGKGVIGLFRGHANQGSQAVNDSTLSFEQEKYLKTVISLTPSHFIRPRDSVSKLRGLQEEDPVRKHSYSSTLSKAMNTLRTSGGKGTIGSFGSSVSKQIQRLNHGLREGNETRVTPSSPEKYSHQNKTSLYIIGEKNQIRGVKPDHFPNCEFIPAEVHDAKNVKQSFKKLLRACCPSLPSNESDVSFYKEIRASEWYQQLQTIMQLSSTVVDIIDEEECSVMICLEDGWDLVPQITSIAQLCLDPFYRTFRGFRTLIEKEWLAFGHRFSHRSNHIAATLTSGFAPIFLQFLDIVHQIMNQFALSFEFNNYFLKFLAYHYVSCRFRTFLLDSENERAELGWLLEDLKRTNDPGNDLEFDDDASISGHSFSAPLSDKFNYIGTSFWTYAEAAWSKTSLFYNFLYEPTNESDDKVLRPSCNQCILSVWDYYCEESLAHGFSYDLELVKMEKQRREEVAATEHSSTQRKRSRKVCNALSECVPDTQPSSLTQLLDQVRKLEQMVGYNCNPTWSSIWNKVEIPLLSTTGLSRNAQTESFDSLAQLTGLSGCQAISSLSQKRLASSISVRNRFANLVDAGSNQFVYSHRPHRFERCAFTKPTNCEACRNVLWGFAKTDMKCSDCNFSCHSKCADQASNNCPGFGASKKLMPLVPDSQPKIPPPVPPPPTMSQNGHQRTSASTKTANAIPEESSAMTLNRSDTFFDEFSHPERVADNITFQGYLNKRGALLKNWKQRWFVLDSIKHQLRYYDWDDQACRGWIELADVTGVQSTGGTSFELITRKRGYSFSANTVSEAQEWVEKIQACLQ